MTARSAPGGLDVLEGVTTRTSVPVRRRRDFLRELQHDVESLTEELEAEGVAPREARRRARTLLLPDGESLERWTVVHEPPWLRLRRVLEERRLRSIERGAFTAVVALAALIGAGLVRRIEVMGDPSAFLWPVLGTGVLLFAACLYHAVLLWGRGDADSVRRTLWWVLFLCTGTLAVAATGVIADVILLLGQLQQDPGQAARALTAALRRDATLLAIALLQAMGGAVFWLVATQWIAISEDALARALLDSRQSIFKEQTS